MLPLFSSSFAANLSKHFRLFVFTICQLFLSQTTSIIVFFFFFFFTKVPQNRAHLWWQMSGFTMSLMAQKMSQRVKLPSRCRPPSRRRHASSVAAEPPSNRPLAADHIAVCMDGCVWIPGAGINSAFVPVRLRLPRPTLKTSWSCDQWR